jgi:hypothetical protein
MTGQHRLADLDRRLGATGRGGDAGAAAVDETELQRIFDAHP